jgi:hypothetical protein
MSDTYPCQRVPPGPGVASGARRGGTRPRAGAGGGRPAGRGGRSGWGSAPAGRRRSGRPEQPHEVGRAAQEAEGEGAEHHGGPEQSEGLEALERRRAARSRTLTLRHRLTSQGSATPQFAPWGGHSATPPCPGVARMRPVWRKRLGRRCPGDACRPAGPGRPPTRLRRGRLPERAVWPRPRSRIGAVAPGSRPAACRAGDRSHPRPDLLRCDRVGGFRGCSRGAARR